MKIESHPKNLSRIREALSETMAGTSLSEEIQGSIMLAVVEACSNIIRHSYNNDPSHEIDLILELTDTELIITIEDSGDEFNLCEAEARDVNEVRPGGLGIYIIKETMDHMDYCRTPEGCNRIKLIKKL